MSQHTTDQIAAALNQACDDITAAAALPDTGTRDALHLLAAATLHYLAGGTCLRTAIEANWQKPYEEVIAWARA